MKRKVNATRPTNKKFVKLWTSSNKVRSYTINTNVLREAPRRAAAKHHLEKFYDEKEYFQFHSFVRTSSDFKNLGQMLVSVSTKNSKYYSVKNETISGYNNGYMF